MKKPTVSIIIPVYNKVEYLRNCIDALLSQEYNDYEIVIVDDGSTDGSSELLDAVKHENDGTRITVYHQKNQGVSVARNTGMSLAQGDWIWFVDADDIPDCLWLSKIQRYLENYKYDIIFSDYTQVSQEHVDEIKTMIQGEVNPEEFPNVFMQLQYKNGYFGYLWCKLLRKSFVEKCQAFFEPGLTLAEDLKFLTSLYRKKPRAVFTSDHAYNYTLDANNSSKDKKIDYISQLEIQYDIYQWINETALFEKYKDELKKHISYYVSFVFFYGYENDCTLTRELKWWADNKKYKVCLEPKMMTGIMKLLAILLKWERNKLVVLTLKTRTLLRNTYRIGKEA